MEHAKEYQELNNIIQEIKSTKFRLLKTTQYGKPTTGTISTISATGESLQSVNNFLTSIKHAGALAGLSIGSTASWWVAILSLAPEKEFEEMPFEKAEEAYNRLVEGQNESIPFLEKALDSLACEKLLGSSYVLNGLLILAKQQCDGNLVEHIQTRTEIYGPVSSVEQKAAIIPLIQHCRNKRLDITEQKVPNILSCVPKRWRLQSPEPNPKNGLLSETRGIVTASCSLSAKELTLKHRRVRNQKPTVDVEFKFSVEVPSEAEAEEVTKIPLSLSVTGKHISENAGATGSIVGYKGVSILSHGLKNSADDAVIGKLEHASIRFPSERRGDDIFMFEAQLVDGPGNVGQNCRVRYSYKYE